MKYGIYKSARNASWKCLIDCGVSELPIKPVQIAAHYGISCKPVNRERLNGASGEIKAVNGKTFIFFCKDEPKERQRYTIMHELGHYLLGHLGEVPLSRSESECRPEEEQAADKFAIDVLAPACVLWGLNLHTAEDIAGFCGISAQAARFRAQRMHVLYQRGMFLVHPLERKVYSQFFEFIHEKFVGI